MIRIFPDVNSLMRGAAEVFVEEARRAVTARGRFSVVLAGGSTPKRAYQLLAAAPLRSQVDWSRVHIFWSDERCVPPDDERSNFRMVREALLDHVPIADRHVHRIDGEAEPSIAAKDYEAVLTGHFGAEPVRFDLVFLGLGKDGHTASLFPETSVLGEQTRHAVEVFAPELGMWRVTLTAPLINAAASVAFLVSGADKADILHRVLVEPRDPQRLPAQLVQPTAREPVWLVDRAAASRLPIAPASTAGAPDSSQIEDYREA